MKKKALFILIPVVLLFSCSKNNTQTTPEISLDEDTIKEREDFDTYCNEFFLSYLGNNAYHWNVFTVNPKSFGYERDENYKASYTTYLKSTDEDMKETYQMYQDEITLISKYNYEKLSSNQQITYDYIAGFLEKQAEYYNPENGFDDYLDLNYIDSNGGSVADFDSMIKGYHINTVYDVIDMNSYISSTTTAFNSYFEYAQDKIEKGYALSDKTIDGMTSFLDDITSQGEDYYLFTVVEDKISSSTLSQDDKNNYLPLLEESLKECYLPAVNDLSSSLKTLKGSLQESDEGYYSKYGDKAKQMYKYNLESLLGYDDINIEDYIKELDEGISSYMTSINQVILKLQLLSNKEYDNFLKYVMVI